MNQSPEFLRAHNKLVRLTRHVTALEEILKELKHERDVTSAERQSLCSHPKTIAESISKRRYCAVCSKQLEE